MSKPVNTASRVMRQMTEQERHERELVDLHEGWKNRERELLAHIERLEAEQAIACTRCGGCGEDHVTVPRELDDIAVAHGTGEVRYIGNLMQEELEDAVRDAWRGILSHYKATHKPHLTDSDTKGE